MMDNNDETLEKIYKLNLRVEEVYNDLPINEFGVNGINLDHTKNKGIIKGIYAIYNTQTCDIYIGKSTDVYSRLSQHFSVIRCKGMNANSLMLTDYYRGLFDVKCLLLENLGDLYDDQYSKFRESEWMHFFRDKGYRLYNLSIVPITEFAKKSIDLSKSNVKDAKYKTKYFNQYTHPKDSDVISQSKDCESDILDYLKQAVIDKDAEILDLKIKLYGYEPTLLRGELNEA